MCDQELYWQTYPVLRQLAHLHRPLQQLFQQGSPGVTGVTNPTSGKASYLPQYFPRP